MRAALLAALLALPAHAEDARGVLAVQDGTVRTADGQLVDVTGGAYLDEPALLATSRELVALRAENAELRKPAPTAAPLIVASAALVVGLAAGFAAGLVLRR